MDFSCIFDGLVCFYLGKCYRVVVWRRVSFFNVFKLLESVLFFGIVFVLGYESWMKWFDI